MDCGIYNSIIIIDFLVLTTGADTETHTHAHTHKHTHIHTHTHTYTHTHRSWTKTISRNQATAAGACLA